jgi:hypothetical protein
MPQRPSRYEQRRELCLFQLLSDTQANISQASTVNSTQAQNTRFKVSTASICRFPFVASAIALEEMIWGWWRCGAVWDIPVARIWDADFYNTRTHAFERAIEEEVHVLIDCKTILNF